MANDYAENLRALLLGVDAVRSLVPGGIHENTVPQSQQGKVQDYIWLQQTNLEYTRTFDEPANTPPKSVFFDVECCSEHLDRSCTLASAVRALFPFAGDFGDSTVKGAWSHDQGEDYVPVNEMEAAYIHAQSLKVEIMP